MNLRKDHYRSTAPAPVRALSPRARCTHSAAARALTCGRSARPKGLSNSRSRRESGGRRARRGRRALVLDAPTCLAPRLRSGTAVCARVPALVPLFLSFFFALSDGRHSSAGASRPGPRAPAAGRARQEPQTQARPRRRGAGRLTGTHNSPGSSGALGGVFKVPAAGNGDRGAPGGLASINPIPISSPNDACRKINKEYNS